ncbi:CPBP family glutamic-type intramembrane protease [Enterococcus sp. SMC-9]|uniref:CPBP family glutamic-type intramembrane protease n=1 Tax=Enterococcus sp. SMC-9 TaxID=2862343 RepID=UPI001E471A2F|nr:CPBP family glutamic-type intramembrane protease [Enterococcus sp. SMC-9]MCD1025622.1 CPBP family intramembrane metalloprotease [Enterococcus sp. SMC-9]
MNRLESKPLQTRNIVLGALFLCIGFTLLSLFTWAWWALLLGSIAAWLIVFKKDLFTIFTFPKHSWIILVGFVGYLILGIVVGTLANFLGFSWAGNPIANQLGSMLLKIPFMLMGEELLGIGILETARNKGLSLMSSSLLSALIFGLMHSFVYWDGSIFSTLLHVLLLQGVARLIFNSVYLKTNHSIWGSWLSHVLVDIVTLIF